LEFSRPGRTALAIWLESARISKIAIGILTMFAIGNPILWIIGVPALGALLFLLRGHFSAETRERRRGQSHRPVISQKHGPTVRSAVDLDKPKGDRKR
jgi:hypothetical protein